MDRYFGARYTSDEKQYIYNYSCNVCGPPNPNAPPGGYPYAVTYSTGTGYPNAEQTYHIPTGKVEVDYKIDHDNLLYASVNRGAKGGGWSAPSSGYVNLNPSYTILPVLNLNYNEERLTNYEDGLQVDILERRGAPQRLDLLLRLQGLPGLLPRRGHADRREHQRHA